IFLGLNAGIATTPDTFSGHSNVFLGNNAGVANQLGMGNIFIGMNAGNNNVNGGTSVMIGALAGQTTTQSEENIFIGYLAGGSSGGGDQNVYLGAWAGGTWGSRNVMLGNLSGSSNSGDGNIFIGYGSGYYETGSNKLYIANSDTSTPLIKGTFPNVDLDLTATNINLNGILSTTGNAAVGGILTATGNANLNGIQTWVNHNTGTSNGLFIKKKSATYPWHFYEYSTGNLNLYYDTTLRGSFNYTTGVYTSSSDKRFKKNIEEFTNVLDKLMLLTPKRYHFISQNDSEQKYIGLIAQDVKELFPTFVQYNEEDDKYTMDYAGLSVIAIQAIKEQQEMIEEQQIAIEENKKFKAEIDDLRLEIEEIKKQLK
ncbi:MAG: tail fiber domain-containing protein, partial [Candidatus Delongbacteria bacterium]|nr:tail fiber domain-containing protein [Candidatus Delongbacteria bacterium]